MPQNRNKVDSLAFGSKEAHLNLMLAHMCEGNIVPSECPLLSTLEMGEPTLSMHLTPDKKKAPYGKLLKLRAI